MKLWIFTGKTFEETFENTQRRLKSARTDIIFLIATIVLIVLIAPWSRLCRLKEQLFLGGDFGDYDLPQWLISPSAAPSLLRGSPLNNFLALLALSGPFFAQGLTTKSFFG